MKTLPPISRIACRLAAAGLLVAVSLPADTSTVPRDDLVIELLFSGDAQDGSGNGYHGEIHDAVLAPDRFGRPDHAFRFDGDDWVIVDPPPAFSDEQITVSMWAHYDRVHAQWWNNCMFGQDNGNEESGRRVLQISTNGPSVVWHRMMEEDLFSPAGVQAKTWVHIAATYDGEHHRLYVDGLHTDTEPGTLRKHDEEPLYIGRCGDMNWNFTFEGILDDVRVYNRALTGEEVLQLYRETP